MKHFFSEIDGWFDFQDLYHTMVQRAKGEGEIFVEIGAHKGSSTSFMAVEIMNSGKDIDFYAIDSWHWGMELSLSEKRLIKDTLGEKAPFDLAHLFQANLFPVKDFVNPIRGFSENIAKNIENECINFLFIDGDHHYEPFKTDLDSWLPKMRPDSIIAGHDYCTEWPDVINLVNSYFPRAIKLAGRSWVVELKGGKPVENFGDWTPKK